MIFPGLDADVFSHFGLGDKHQIGERRGLPDLKRVESKM